MYDFCFTPFYSALLAAAGLYAYFATGSTSSLAGGLGSAAVLALLTYISFTYYKKRKSCKPAVFLSLVIAGALTYSMYDRFSKTQAVAPAVMAFSSGMMSAFYTWNLFLGPKPKGKKSW